MKCCMSLLVVVALLVGIVFAGRYFDRLPPVNEATKTCLVTGASSGIGCEIVREMVRRGWKVIGIARRASLLNELERQLGSEYFMPYVCDVRDPSAVSKVSNDIKTRGLKPTLFFLNAGAGSKDVPYKFSVQQHQEAFNTNYFGVIVWVEAWLNDVKLYGGGTFVATSSVMSLFAMPGVASYCTSKAAVNSCFQSLRLQYRNDNIGFITVVPGPVKTEMLKSNTSFPFTHRPDEEARYIVQQVFKGEKQIEPSWIYAPLFRVLHWVPERLIIKMLRESDKDFMKEKKQNDHWDAQHYKKNSQGQYGRGMGLVDELALRGNEYVLDVGCGDGRITAEIAKKVPQGFVVGVDISQNMISEAKKSFGLLKNLEFECGDASQFISDKKFDIAVSNSALHWMRDQKNTFKNIYQHLKPGGQLVINMSGQHEGPISQVHESQKWAALLARNGETYFPQTVETLGSMLKICGFQNIEVTCNIAAREFQSKDELFNWLFAWVPHSTGLPEPEAREFTNDIMDLVGKARQDGKLVVESAILHAHAVKVEND